MTEATLDQKRKIVEISLPKLSWRYFFSRKFLIVYFSLLIASFISYWFFAIRPYLWLSSGRIDSVSSTIRSQERAFLTKFNVEEGERVQKGSLLFSFEEKSLLEELKKGERAALEIPAQIQFHQKEAERAMQEYLSSIGVRPQDETDQYLQMLQDEQIKIESLQQERAGLEKNLIELRAKIESLSAKAPFDGIILKMYQKEGDPIYPGDPVISLFNSSQSWIEVKIPEDHLHLVRIGQPAKIRLIAYPGKEWQGEVVWIAPATIGKIDGSLNSSKETEIPIKISVPKGEFPITPGLTASVGIKVH